MSKVNLSETPDYVPVRINSQVTLRVKEAVPHVSRESGNPSIKFTFEIAEPNTITVDGVEQGISGIELTRYVSTVNDPKKLGTLKTLHKACGLPLDDIDFDDETRFPLNVQYVGAECKAYVASLQETKKDGGGQPLINPNTGEPSVYYKHDIREFYSR